VLASDRTPFRLGLAARMGVEAALDTRTTADAPAWFVEHNEGEHPDRGLRDVPPTVACSARAAVHVLRTRPDLVAKLRENTRWFRRALEEAGFSPFSYPVVPGGGADPHPGVRRARAAHVERALEAFVAVGRESGIVRA
jgi:hypothetical protein